MSEIRLVQESTLKEVVKQTRKKRVPSRYMPIIRLFDEKKIGEGVVLSGLTTADLAQISGLAVRQGFFLKHKRKKEGYFLYKGRSEYKPKSKKNALHVISRLEAGDTLEEIAVDLGITRQAIEHRVVRFKAHNRPNELPPEQRVAAADAFMAPYLAMVNDPHCLTCHTKMGDHEKRKSGMCFLCREAIRMRLETASRLRSFMKSGDRHAMSEAAVRIKKYGLKPEHLKYA